MNLIETVNLVLEKKKNEFGNEVNQDWKLNKRVTLPEDCNLDTIDVVCDKKKTIGLVTQRLRWINPKFIPYAFV